MSSYVKLLNNLEHLQMNCIKQNIDSMIDSVNEKEISYVDSLLELTTAEIKFRNEKAKYACVRTANFPYIKEFKDFDFTFQPSLNMEQIKEFKTNLKHLDLWKIKKMYCF